MSKEITFILEPDIGKLTTEVSAISNAVLTDLRADLGTSQNVNCGKPLQPDAVNLSTSDDAAPVGNQSIWLYRIYHNSVVDGPGRRSVIQVAGCSIRCPGCYVPDTHDHSNGTMVSVSHVVSEILKEKDSCDGVTILGGEPFDQSPVVAELVSRLKHHGLHVMVYSGFTIEQLINKKVPCIDYILTHIDLLIDGPFLNTMRLGSIEYRGSRNQRIIDLAESSR